MPEISRFFGIVVRMYFNDHNPPHFHARYGKREAVVAIDSASVLYSNLPARAEALAVEWAVLHREALLENWRLLRAAQQPLPVAPLD